MVRGFADFQRLHQRCKLLARIEARFRVTHFFTICSRLCRFRFFFVIKILQVEIEHLLLWDGSDDKLFDFESTETGPASIDTPIFWVLSLDLIRFWGNSARAEWAWFNLPVEPIPWPH